MSNSHQRRYTVGYVLAPKKVHTFIKPSLIDHAKERGIDIIELDPNRPLSDQGDIDCVIHKLYDESWKQNLEEFKSRFPNVTIIDSIDAIDRVHNRVTMLEFMNHLSVNHTGSERFSVPNQILVSDPADLLAGGATGDLNFPVIAKPLEANGTEISHQMYLVFDEEGIKILTAPVVLQEFVNHGGVVFKVYVAGDHVKCVNRKSLPDITEEKMKSLKGALPFSQISNLSAEDYKKEEDSNVEKAEMPPLSFLKNLAMAMKEAMGLNLFNFDLIRDGRDCNNYIVIDINYFPGYAKMPGFESMLTDFFVDVVHKKKDKGVEQEVACSE